MDIVDEPRDLWDLRYLLNKEIDIAVVRENYKRKYAVDIYLPNLISALKRQNYRSNWDNRLKNQIANLPSYNAVAVELESLIHRLFYTSRSFKKTGGKKQ